jgi:CheY-like chemotaxis protein
MDLFTEIFPIAHPPRVTAYALRFSAPPPDPARAGRVLARRLSKLYGSGWLWADPLLLTDDDRSPVELGIALDILRGDLPDLLGTLDALAVAPQPASPQAAAEFVIKTRLKPLEARFDAALKPFNATLHTPSATVRAERDYTFRGWSVGGAPCVSISISTRLTYGHDLQTFAQTLADPAGLVGLRVIDRATGTAGDVVKVTGSVDARRPRMMARVRSEAQQRLIRTAPGTGLAVRVKAGSRQFELPARLLEPVLRPRDYAIFGLDAAEAERALRPDPQTRSQMVKALSDLAKAEDILLKAFNSREHADRFETPPFEPYVRFGERRTRPHVPARLPDDFTHLGAYRLRDLYRSDPIEICVVNAIAMTLEDFVEALQRQLARGFDFTINVLRERRIRVVSLPNVEAAVRVVEQEAPDLILAFLPDEYRESGSGGDDDITGYMKSLTLGRGIPTHVIFKSTLDDPDSMAGIVMAILAKTGNTPFALADTLEFADYVVGFDLVRDDAQRLLTGIARVYQADGTFVRFAVRAQPVTDEKIQFVLMRDLFPQRTFGGKRIVIHHDGELPAETRQALKLWGQAIKATFATVEMIRRGAPRLYAFEGRKVVAPPEGTAFLPDGLDGREAFFVPAVDPSQPTPQPMHVLADGLGIRAALLSIRLFTLLYYGTGGAGLLPVTTVNAGELAYWLRKGGIFTEHEGEVPFWL